MCIVFVFVLVRCFAVWVRLRLAADCIMWMRISWGGGCASDSYPVGDSTDGQVRILLDSLYVCVCLSSFSLCGGIKL